MSSSTIAASDEPSSKIAPSASKLKPGPGVVAASNATSSAQPPNIVIDVVRPSRSPSLASLSLSPTPQSPMLLLIIVDSLSLPSASEAAVEVKPVSPLSSPSASRPLPEFLPK
ncbi:hypothetical protein GALMADRAFT_139210 [Galerina marginata CBS 339.88]|uniref:Uncharacterized protein n=1 Tax=Galerina marginata (strain CBS 339.88) TaxID=685588 RepID=A0A067T227_GALM3|nr:hypothetical protein GALMADRAFT_139210 [Galerina marginata CBS 339.88]